jgi:SOS-response transcriptional repressor LexA
LRLLVPYPLVAIFTTWRKSGVAITERDGAIYLDYESAMLSEWLQSALETSGVGQSELSRQLTLALGRSIDRAAVNKMTKGTRAIAADELKVIERVTGHEAPTEIEVPLKGYIGAGEAVEAVADMDDGETVPAPRDARPGTVAATVRGNSMFPTLRDGWTLYWSKMLPAHELINDLCVVHLEDGRILVKVLRAGSAPDFWTLQSVNPAVADMPDQAVRWVSPIDWIKPH